MTDRKQTENQCPVCEMELPEPVPSFCERCGWELKNDLTFGIFLDLPDAVIEEYRQRVGIARKHWDEKAELLKKQAELEERLRRMEVEMRKQRESETVLHCQLSKLIEELKETETEIRRDIGQVLIPKIGIETVSGMEFIYVPAGKLIKNGKEVIVNHFYIGKFPVTQGQWKKIMGNNPSHFQKGDDYPVENVSWNDAREFIRELNQIYQGTNLSFRLPSEAEWEYAARAGSDGGWCFGDDERLLEQYAWYDQNSGGSTHPVGQLKPNAWGLYDMYGNVWEWCADTNLGDSYYRLLRGWSWNTRRGPVELTDYGFQNFGNRSNTAGFRVLVMRILGPRILRFKLGLMCPRNSGGDCLNWDCSTPLFRSVPQPEPVNVTDSYVDEHIPETGPALSVDEPEWTSSATNEDEEIPPPPSEIRPSIF